LSGVAARVVQYLRPYRLPFAAALGLTLALTALELLKPWPLKLIVDHVLGSQPPPAPLGAVPREALLLGASLGLVVIYLLLAVLTVASNATTIGIGQRMVNDLRGDLYGHLQRLSLAFHGRRSVGDLLYRVTADTYALQTLAMNGLFPVLSALLLLAGMFVVMVRIDWRLTVLALAVVPALGVAIALLNTRIETAALRARAEESAVYALVQRTLAGMRVVQAFGKEDEEHVRFMRASQDSLRANLSVYTLQTAYSGVVNVVLAAGTALVVWVGARHAFAGALSVGELIVFVSYLASLYSPITSVVQTWGLVSAARAGVRRVFEVLDLERDLPDGPRALPGRARGEIAWRGVTFEYVPGRPVLRGVTLTVRPGEKVAIVGPSGSGKTTLVSLVPRFYDPAAGRVTLDGVDLRDLALRDVRRQVAMVLQPPLVFPMTIRENVAYGRPGADAERVVAAARLARVHDVVARLPRGYDTPVGESGVTLSEGEKQRLTLARALLVDAPILILDEPTSSVDVETERLIMRELGRLAAGRTTLIVAHRLLSVRLVDRIVLLAGGAVVEDGAFGDLMRTNGPFAALFRAQFDRGREPAGVR
jgi:ATP-binding cassette subfamily B protein/subfamily B ATP-binding cassette protein MsbA